MRKDISRDAAHHHDTSQAPEVITVDNESVQNHRPVIKPVATVATVPRREAHRGTRPPRKIKSKDTQRLHATMDDKIVIIQEVSHASKIQQRS